MEIFQHLSNGIVLGCIYTLVSLGLTLIFGIIGLVNFAHGELYMLGAFLAFFASSGLGLNYFFSVAFAITLMVLVGMVIERTCFRPLRGKDDTSVIVSTIGLSVLLQNLAIFVFGADPQRLSTELTEITIRFWGVSFNVQRLLIVVVTVALIFLLNYFSKNTKTGKAMRACAQDLTAAKIVGININKVTMVTCMIGAALAAVAGALVAPLYLVSPVMGIKMVVKSFAVVIVGGLGNVTGAILGGFLVGVSESIAAGMISSHMRDGVAFGILILVLLLKPEGIFTKRIQEKV
jgi:branched-chain amino acid transport system permease protein